MTIDIYNKKWDNLIDVFNLDEDEYIIYEDKFGQRWKLIPVTNKNIIMPFIITPVGDRK